MRASPGWSNRLSAKHGWGANMPDFGLLQSPNFAASALAGLQAGQAMGRRKQVDAALSGVDLTRPETLTPLLKADPEHGIALLGASSALLKNERELAARQATTEYLTERFKPSVATGGTPMPGGQAAPTATLAPASTGVTNAEHALMQADPEGYLKLRENIDKMDKAARDRLVESQTALHDLAVATANLPYEQRKAYIAAHANDLAAHYVTPEQISGFDPTDQNLQVVTNEALGVKGVADRADKRAAMAETQRHNRVSEGTAAGHLSLDKQKEARIAKWGPQSIILGGAVPNNTDDLDY